MSIGDLLFYRSHGGLFDDAITLATGAPYTHVEIQVSETESVGALSEGIVRHMIPSGADVARASERMDSERLGDALRWLARQIGQPYGWSDIADDAEQVVAKRTPVVVIRPGEMCCSDLATRFLIHAGFRGMPDALFDQPELVSPHALARWLAPLMPAPVASVSTVPPQKITTTRYLDMSERARDFARRMLANPHTRAMLRRLADK